MLLITKGATYAIAPGDHFDLLLPDGSLLHVEQTADDFSIVRANDLVAYSKPTSVFAKHNTDDDTQTTGKN